MTHPYLMEEAVTRIVSFFEHFTAQDLAQLGRIYDTQARFKDPFNEVQGVPAIQQVYHHMFVSLHEPRFVVTERLLQGQRCVLTWEFHFRFKRFDTETLQTVRGASHLLLDAQGRICDHRDYWDAAEELYEKIPLLGGLMRWLKRHANR